MERINYKEVPAGLMHVLLGVQAYVDKSGLEHSLLELVKLRASQINKCGYCLDMHSKDAIHAGETVQRIVSLPAWKETSYYSDRERAALAYTEALTLISEHHDLDAIFEELHKHYTKTEIANLTVTITQINTWNRVAISFGTTPGSYQVAEKKAVRQEEEVGV